MSDHECFKQNETDTNYIQYATTGQDHHRYDPSLDRAKQKKALAIIPWQN